MTNRTRLATFLSTLLAAGSVLAGDAKPRAYAYSSSGDDVQVVISGEGEGNVLVLSDAGSGGAHSLRMKSTDGRMVIETEPDAARPWLGVLLTTTDEGIRVDSVMDGSPAARAGLEAGDLIIAVDDRDLRGSAGRGNLLEGKRPGERMRFRVLREGGEQTLRVRLDSHPGRVEFEIDDEMGPFAIAGNALEGLGSLNKLESLKGLSMLPLFDCDGDRKPCLPSILSFARSGKPRLGIALESLSPQLAEFFGVSAGEGLLIKEVGEDSVAERAGLQAGDVLVRIDDTPIASTGDIRRAIGGVGKGQAVLIEVVRHGARESFTAELDTEPNEEPSGSFNFFPNLDLNLEGTQGSLRWLEENRGRLGSEAMDEARQAIEKAAAAVKGDRAARESASSAEARRALEEALASARGSASSEAQRTF